LQAMPRGEKDVGDRPPKLAIHYHPIDALPTIFFVFLNSNPMVMTRSFTCAHLLGSKSSSAAKLLTPLHDQRIQKIPTFRLSRRCRGCSRCRGCRLPFAVCSFYVVILERSEGSVCLQLLLHLGNPRLQPWASLPRLRRRF
jgi:hypothetical protein